MPRLSNHHATHALFMNTLAAGLSLILSSCSPHRSRNLLAENPVFDLVVDGKKSNQGVPSQTIAKLQTGLEHMRADGALDITIARL